MRTAVCVVVLVISSREIGRADDSASSGVDGATRITARASRWLEQPGGPLLHLDDLPGPRAQTAGDVDRESWVLDRGRGLRIAADGTWWSATPSTSLVRGSQGVAHGWHGGAELSYDLGPLRIGAHAGVGQVDDWFEHGSYRFAGLSVYRTFILSRWMVAWISLRAELRQWAGTPPPGETSSGSIKLSVGTTFR
jgi:hypothetical protein